VVVTRQDNGRSLQLSCNQELSVHLRESPSTGFRWRVENSDETALKLQDDVFALDPVGGIGRGGQRILTYIAVKPADVKLHLELRRPWEPGQAPADSFSLSVSIVGRTS